MGHGTLLGMGKIQTKHPKQTNKNYLLLVVNAKHNSTEVLDNYASGKLRIINTISWEIQRQPVRLGIVRDKPQ